MKDVAVIGVGQSSFVRGYEGSIRELAFEAFRKPCKMRASPERCGCFRFLFGSRIRQTAFPCGRPRRISGPDSTADVLRGTVCSSSSTGLKWPTV